MNKRKTGDPLRPTGFSQYNTHQLPVRELSSPGLESLESECSQLKTNLAKLKTELAKTADLLHTIGEYIREPHGIGIPAQIGFETNSNSITNHDFFVRENLWQTG
jgi:hypothetical protein